MSYSVSLNQWSTGLANQYLFGVLFVSGPKNPDPMTTDSFRLLAIRPLQDCAKRFRKNLIPGELYLFYNEFSFLSHAGEKMGNGEELACYSINASVPNDLYRIKANRKIPIDINICAIVGKNGSGKSTLLELLYLTSYIIASSDEILPGFEKLNKWILEAELQKKRAEITKKETPHKNRSLEENEALEKAEKELNDAANSIVKYQSLLFELKEIYRTAALELIFSKNGQVFSLSIKNGVVTLHVIPLRVIGPIEIPSALWKKDLNDNTPGKPKITDYFFYSIAINYSIYGLNNIISGNWLEYLFHKNDGYQTPLVINPFRDEGIIDINNEYHLAQTRLLSNLVGEGYAVNEIAADRRVSKLSFEIAPFLSTKIFDVEYKWVLQTHYMHNDHKVIDFFVRLLKELVDFNLDELSVSELNTLYAEEILQTNSEAMDSESSFKLKFKEDHLSREKLLYLIMKYVFGKIIKICNKYEEYFPFGDLVAYSAKVPILKDVDELIKKLKKDESHITLKIRQILNNVKHGLFCSREGAVKWKLRDKDVGNEDIRYFREIELSEFIHFFKSIIPNGKELEKFLPIAFFRPDLFISSDGGEGNDLPHLFSELSSGQQQQVHSLQSIYYHINNIDSVFASSNKEKGVTYPHINIILDEVELYYHPEIQRTFISELLTGLDRLRLKNIKGINVLFSTHSPFILSDIPGENILKLKKGYPKLYNKKERTFGANIHDLLADDFFLEEGYMGKYAVKKISELNKKLKVTEKNLFKTEERTQILKLIDIIGEPLIRNSMREIYVKSFKHEIDEKIAALLKLREEL